MNADDADQKIRKSFLICVYPRLISCVEEIRGGRLWVGKREDVVPNRIIIEPLDQETFLATLDMLGQRSVSKTKAPRFVNHINYPTRTQRPRPKRARFDRHRGPRFDDNAARHDRHPTEIEMLPALQRLDRTRKRRFTFTNLNAIVIDVVTGGRRSVRCPAFSITKR